MHLPDVLYVLVVLGAVLIRVYRLLDVPHTLWVDEAWFALKARDLVRGIDFIPIERPGLGVGDSPMQVYLAAVVQLLGLSVPYSARIASCFVGSVTVVLLYPMLITVWRSEEGETRSRWLALIATFILAGMFSHLYASRVGMQYGLSVLATVVSVWFSWLAFEHLDIRWALGAGLAVGLSQYTYESCRLLPILVGVIGFLRFAQAQKREIRRRTLVITGLVALSTCFAVSPLLLVYLRDPSVYVLHMEDCSSGVLSGSQVQVLGKVLWNYLVVLGGVSLRGDMLPGRNLVGMPMLAPVLSVLGWIGFIIRVRHVSGSRASQLFVVWFLIMLLPSALSDEAPASNRMLAAAPAVASFVALGVCWIWQRLRIIVPRAPKMSDLVWLQISVAAALVSVLIMSQAQNVRAYFVQWAEDPGLFDGISMGPRLAADRALELAKTDRVYFTPASDSYNRMINDLLLHGSRVREVDGTVCLPLVDRSSQTTDYVVVTVADHDSLAKLHDVYPAGQEIDSVIHPDGYAYAVVFQVPAGEPGPVIQSPVAVEFAEGPTLVGYCISTQQKLQPGDSFELDLYWKGSQSHNDDAVSFVHVGKGQQSDPLIASHDVPVCGGTYSAVQWSADEVLVDRHTLVVAPDAQEGVYDVAVGVYRAVDQARFGVVSSDVPELDDRVFIAQVQIQGR